MKKKREIWGRVAAVFGIAVLVACLWIMLHGIGLSDRLDFGAGAYYYADIPEFYESFGVTEAFKPALPDIVYIIIFLAWGALMYLLWKWVDKR